MPCRGMQIAKEALSCLYTVCRGFLRFLTSCCSRHRRFFSGRIYHFWLFLSKLTSLEDKIDGAYGQTIRFVVTGSCEGDWIRVLRTLRYGKDTN